MYNDYFGPPMDPDDMTEADRKWLRNVGLAIFAVIILVFAAFYFSGPVLSQEVKACQTIEMALAQVDTAQANFKARGIKDIFIVIKVTSVEEVAKYTIPLTKHGFTGLPDKVDALLVVKQVSEEATEYNILIFTDGCYVGMFKAIPEHAWSELFGEKA